jgi:hypothetical protein
MSGRLERNPIRDSRECWKELWLADATNLDSGEGQDDGRGGVLDPIMAGTAAGLIPYSSRLMPDFSMNRNPWHYT